MLKKVLVSLIILLLLIEISGITVNAANEKIVINKTVTPYKDVTLEDGGGEIVININNFTPKKDANYKFKLEFNELVTQWYDISQDNIDVHKMTIMLEKSKTDIFNILKITDEAYLTVQEIINEETNTIIDKQKVDIKLPLSKAFKVGHPAGGYNKIDCIYDLDDIYYKYEKVNDEETLEKYLDSFKSIEDAQYIEGVYWGYYMDNVIDTLDMDGKCPQDGWEQLTDGVTSTKPSEEGLYFLWIKVPQSETNKELLGCVFSLKTSSIQYLENQLLELKEKNKELAATVTYAPSMNTEEEVTVTITANKKIKSVNGWTLSEDQMTLTKKYRDNATETIKLEDTYGKTVDITIEISNIENEQNKELTATVLYTISADTTENVTAIIKTNKKVKGVNGWKLLDDGMTLIKTYSDNVTETVQLVDEYGKTRTVTVKISNIIKEDPNDEEQEKNKELTATVLSIPATDTTGSVTTIIKTNKKVKSVSGWTLLDDGMTLIKVYTANTTETVHLVDEYGKTKDVTVKVSNIINDSNNNNNGNNNDDNKKPIDDTTAPSQIPQTGVNVLVTVTCFGLLIAVAIFTYKKYNSYKDVK